MMMMMMMEKSVKVVWDPKTQPVAHSHGLGQMASIHTMIWWWGKLTSLTTIQMLMMKHATPQSEVRKERLSKLQHNRKADAAGRPLWCPLINAQIHTWIQTQIHAQMQHKCIRKCSTNTYTNTAQIHTQMPKVWEQRHLSKYAFYSPKMHWSRV